MRGLSRRAFLGVSVGGLSSLQSHGAVLAALPADVLGLSQRNSVDAASALNLSQFLRNKHAFGLTGLLSMRPVEGELGRYPDGSLFLFPFKHAASCPDVRAFLPGRSATDPPIATVALTHGGLPPDEYFCNYVLKAPREGFISFSVGLPFAHGAQKRVWHTNVDDIGGRSIGIGWTSSNLNHPWFAGSRWIPDSDIGKYWRARIIEDLRQAAAVQVSAFGGAVG